MRRSLHIVIAAALAAICVLPAAGQSYKRNNVRPEPEPLVFRKVYSLPGENSKDIYRLVAHWKCDDYNIIFTGGGYGYESKGYYLSAHNQDFDKVIGTIMGNVVLCFYDGEMALEFNRISVDWNNHLILDMSKDDNRLNRPWLWRVNHNTKIVQTARDRCKEIFDHLCSSMDEYLRDGPPMELKRID